MYTVLYMCKVNGPLIVGYQRTISKFLWQTCTILFAKRSLSLSVWIQCVDSMFEFGSYFRYILYSTAGRVQYFEINLITIAIIILDYFSLILL